MKHLKHFNESIHSEDDVSDILLEFIDGGFLTFKSISFENSWDQAGNKVIGASIHYNYIISEEFKKINSDNIQKYLTNLSRFSQTCNRWSLEFFIFRNELTVIGAAPEYIQEFSKNNQFILFSYSDRSTIWTGYRDVSISARFNKNLEFFIVLEPLEHGKIKDVEKFISDKIKIGKGYRLEFTGPLKNPNQYEYKIVPTSL